MNPRGQIALQFGPMTMQIACPIFPVRDVAAALALYGKLGFRTEGHEDGGMVIYGFLRGDQASLHLRPSDDLDPTPTLLASTSTWTTQTRFMKNGRKPVSRGHSFLPRTSPGECGR
jgi:catechol 2,3-dioxygenase-like lactoylglutathione lyase family enzyme